MLIPVFVSSPRDLNEAQDAAFRTILGEVGRVGLEARSLGRTDYPTSFPLREVFQLAKHCAGGLVLGFAQFGTNGGIWKGGTPKETKLKTGQRVVFPTPWNQLEAGILFALGVPLLVFREDGISGGVFEIGTTDLFVQEMPMGKLSSTHRKSLRDVLRKWGAQVQTHYYGR